MGDNRVTQARTNVDFGGPFPQLSVREKARQTTMIVRSGRTIDVPVPCPMCWTSGDNSGSETAAGPPTIHLVTPDSAPSHETSQRTSQAGSQTRSYDAKVRVIAPDLAH